MKAQTLDKIAAAVGLARCAGQACPWWDAWGDKSKKDKAAYIADREFDRLCAVAAINAYKKILGAE